MKKMETIHINEDFVAVDSRDIDDRSRIGLGKLVKTFASRRVRVYQGERGEILLRPVVELPADEAWLYENREAFRSVQKGLKQAKNNKLKEVDPDELDDE